MAHPDSPLRVRERVLAQHDLLRLRLQGLAEGVDALRAGRQWARVARHVT